MKFLTKSYLLTWIPVQLRGQPGVGVVHPLGAATTKHSGSTFFSSILCDSGQRILFFLLVVSLPELDGSDVGGDEDGAAQEGVEGGGEDG